MTKLATLTEMKAQIFLLKNGQLLAATDKNGMFTTIDTLIVHDCFTGNNVMRAEEAAANYAKTSVPFYKTVK